MDVLRLHLDLLQVDQLSVRIHVGTQHQKNRHDFARLAENRRKFKWRNVREVSAKEIGDEALNLCVELVRVEASHDAQSHHVRINHVLFHLLTLRHFLLLLHLELGVLGDALDDGHCNPSVLLHVVLSELFKGVLNVFNLGALLAIF